MIIIIIIASTLVIKLEFDLFVVLLFVTLLIEIFVGVILL